MVSLALHGGRTCLDFVNTVDPREPAGQDFLPDYSAIVAWSRRVRLLETAKLARIAARAKGSPRDAARAHRRAIELRELLYPVLRAAADGEAPPPALAERFSRTASALERRRRLVWRDGRWRREIMAVNVLDVPADAVFDDALDLLTTGEHIGRCAGDRCGWLFLDTSKNRSRRWCSMAGCGNRAKARRHYERRRGGRR
jgi:predicted RNA-binding Zn ribbon-like protein